MINAAGGTALDNLDGFSMIPLLRREAIALKEYA